MRISTGTTFGVGARADEAFNNVVGFITPAPVIRKILEKRRPAFKFLGRVPLLDNDFAHDPFLDYGPR